MFLSKMVVYEGTELRTRPSAYRTHKKFSYLFSASSCHYVLSKSCYTCVWSSSSQSGDQGGSINEAFSVYNIDYWGQDFYGKSKRLSITGLLRVMFLNKRFCLPKLHLSTKLVTKWYLVSFVDRRHHKQDLTSLGKKSQLAVVFMPISLFIIHALC